MVEELLNVDQGLADRKLHSSVHLHHRLPGESSTQSAAAFNCAVPMRSAFVRPPSHILTSDSAPYSAKPLREGDGAVCCGRLAEKQDDVLLECGRPHQVLLDGLQEPRELVQALLRQLQPPSWIDLLATLPDPRPEAPERLAHVLQVHLPSFLQSCSSP